MGLRQAGYKQDFDTGVPQIRDECSQDTGNISKDEQNFRSCWVIHLLFNSDINP